MQNNECEMPKVVPGVVYDAGNNRLQTYLGDYRLECFEETVNPAQIATWLDELDGKATLVSMLDRCQLAGERECLQDLVNQLDDLGCIDDASKPQTIDAVAALFEIEDQMNSLVPELIYKNPFWRKMEELQGDYPKSVLYGFAIENYHFLYHEAMFDSPVLAYPSSEKIRLLLNQFYVEEIGHDRLILKALEAVGMSEEELSRRVPLAGTMMMCNALSHWAATDPLFFFITLSLLEGGDYQPEGQADSYIEVCQAVGLSDEFIAPIATHASINKKANHGNLTRDIFNLLPPIAESEVLRLKRKLPMFVEMYGHFYQQIWDVYQNEYVCMRTLDE